MNECVVASFELPEKLASAVTKALAVWDTEKGRASYRRSAEVEKHANKSPREGGRAARGESLPRPGTVSRGTRRSLLRSRGDGRPALARFLELHAPERMAKRRPYTRGPAPRAQIVGRASRTATALDEGPLPGASLRRSVVFTPEARPLSRSHGARAPGHRTTPARRRKPRVRTGLRPPESMATASGSLPKAARWGGLILLVDQFEELYSLCDDERTRGVHRQSSERGARAARTGLDHPDPAQRLPGRNQPSPGAEPPDRPAERPRSGHGRRRASPRNRGTREDRPAGRSTRARSTC